MNIITVKTKNEFERLKRQHRAILRANSTTGDIGYFSETVPGTKIVLK